MVSVGAEKTPDFAGCCVALAMEMLKLPAQRMWLDHDKEADVLYVSFRKLQRPLRRLSYILVRKTAKTLWAWPFWIRGANE